METSIKVLESEYRKPKPWARAVIAKGIEGLVFLSGISGIDTEKDELVAPDMKSQLEHSLKRIKGSLEAAGSSLENVVKVTTYITDVDEWKEFDLNKVLYGYFPHGIASTLVVTRLSRTEMKVENDVIAIIPK